MTWLGIGYSNLKHPSGLCQVCQSLLFNDVGLLSLAGWGSAVENRHANRVVFFLGAF